MDKDTAKKQVRLALQPWLNTNEVLLALLMKDDAALDRMRSEVEKSRVRCDAYCEEIDKCDNEDSMNAVLGRVTRE